MPYLASTPKSPVKSWRNPGVVPRALLAFEITYGLISKFFEPAGAVMPTSVAATDAWCRPGCPRALDGGARNESSFFQRFVRIALKPHVWPSPGRYRSDLKGMAVSTTQP